jgi:geranylgeranyl diphosphate synthase type I
MRPGAVRIPAGEEILADARRRVDPAYRAAVDTLPARIRQVAGYHIGWWDPDGRPSDRPGKAIRPALVLACAQASSGTGITTEAIDPAVSVEALHDFTLLHDDVMDADRTRRHRPAAWTVFGVNAAILTGDALLGLALDRATSADGVKILTAALADLCRGQSADLEHTTNLTLAACLTTAQGKTGALTGAACGLGALAGGAENARVAQFQAFGSDLGVAFQLVDDLLGIWGDPTVTGKPALADLAHGKRTLPVVAALTSGTAAGDELRQLYDHPGPHDPADLRKMAELIDTAGGRTWARRTADAYLAKAFDHLRTADPPHTTGDLRTLADLITRRER